ncbi:MAG: hypothetical protein JXA57_17110 [Armatimonadetes bacterium]|nr:hypothetical protein [Armatimonadota bacterium]
MSDILSRKLINVISEENFRSDTRLFSRGRRIDCIRWGTADRSIPIPLQPLLRSNGQEVIRESGPVGKHTGLSASDVAATAHCALGTQTCSHRRTASPRRAKNHQYRAPSKWGSVQLGAELLKEISSRDDSVGRMDVHAIHRESNSPADSLQQAAERYHVLITSRLRPSKRGSGVIQSLA